MAKYEDITVKLTGNDGNAFSVLAAVRRAMCKAGIEEGEILAYEREAMAGDYNHLLRVTQETVAVT